MNIWIFNHYALPPDLPGGTRHYDLGRNLVGRGHQVVIIATSFDHYMHRETRLKVGEKWKVQDVDGVKFVWLRTPPYQRNDWRRVRNMMVFMLRAWWLGRKLPQLASEVDRPDVVIGSSVHLLTPLAAYWVARYYQVPFVMEVRDLWPQTLIDMGRLSARHPVIITLQMLEKFLYQQAEKIITLLPLAYEYIVACGISREKIVWIPNGVDLSRFNFDTTPPTRTDNREFIIMYLGAHGRANALDVVIQAAKIIQEQGLREIKFILVGAGPEKPRLMNLAKELEIYQVEFREPVPKSQIVETLKEADALLFSLEGIEVFRYGISSNKLFDYMMVRKPIISAAKAMANPVEEARCGLIVSPRDPQALAEAIVRLYQMPEEEREAMGRRGWEYVEKHHNIRMLAERLEQVLTEAVGG